MAEQVMVEMNKDLVKEREIQEKLKDLENRVQLLEIIAKKATPEILVEPQPETKKVIQINAKGKTYFCTTGQEQKIFSENNPGVETETFTIELLTSTADKYLNDSENKKQFTKQKHGEKGEITGILVDAGSNPVSVVRH